MASARSLLLLVPGLLQPPRGIAEQDRGCPTFDAWLARSRRSPGPATHWDAALRVFRLEGPECGAAALHYLAAQGRAPKGWVALAEPVHLRVDPTRALLFGPEVLQLQAAESRQLTDSLNEHLAAEQLELEIAGDGRWYLGGSPQAKLDSHPLPEVVGRNAEPFLPHGAGGSYWRRLLNEIQMLLHRHPVNQQREIEGRPRVSSLWPWGGGLMPRQVSSELASVSGDPVLAALAGLAGIAVTEAPHPGRAASHLHVEQGFQSALSAGDAEAWSQLMHGWERQWADWQAGYGRSRITLWPADGWSYGRRPWDGLRFWRRREAPLFGPPR